VNGRSGAASAGAGTKPPGVWTKWKPRGERPAGGAYRDVARSDATSAAATIGNATSTA